MLKGFYNLASGMLTQTRVLNTVSNNISNTSTPGYKRDTMVNGTFSNLLISRTGNTNKRGTVSLGADQSMIRTAYELVTNYSQGAPEETDRILDFCILGNGFFEVETPNGLLYTRNGSFSVNENGELWLQNVGRVMGESGPINLYTDKINVDDFGTITTTDGEFLGKISIVDFEDYSGLTKIDEGMFQNSNGAGILNPDNTLIKWQAIEASNVQPVNEMMSMIDSQRALQSAAQVLKIYDQLITKAVNDIGRL